MPGKRFALIIPPDAWKKSRISIARSMKRNMHLTETNPGADSNRLRYDYILTKAEVDVFVEETMRATERLVRFYLDKERTDAR